jgi:hypothetical protein
MACVKCGVNPGSTYLRGFCSSCSAGILDKEAKRLRTPKDVAARKLREDIGKAESAIGSLRRIAADPAILHVRSRSWDSDKGDEARVAACRDEIARLDRAIAEPWHLWAIYRRTNKSEPYAVGEVGQ